MRGAGRGKSMDQGVRAFFGGCAATPALVLLLLAYTSSSAARAPPAGGALAEPQGRPVGIVEQPCTALVPTTPPPNDADKTGKDWRERILDPSEGREIEPPDPNALNAMHMAEEERLHNDWAQLCRYRAENVALLHRMTASRVVFMGDSITELWKVAHPDFFGENYIDRGISGQTTAQMLVRFRQDVIALKPAVVHILGGTNDIAGNGGATTLDAIKNNIVSMVDLATANDIRVVIGSVPPAGMFPWRPSVVDPAPHIVEMNEWLRRFAREKNLIYVDYHEPLADERDAMKQTFSNDGVHPNRDGYSVMEPLARHAIDQALASAADAAAKAAASKPAKTKDIIKH
jgi:lysophospholipase L1-like esterase